MATTKTKKTTKRKSSPKRETKAQQHARKQMWAVVLFAVGLLVGALTWISGDNAWRGVHNFLFGALGWSVYFLAPLLIYIAVMAARDKPLSAIKAKLWQVMTLIVMISGAIQIFGAGMPEEEGIVPNVVALYQSGKALEGGGVMGAVFGLPLLGLCGKTGASIIISLSIFVFIMLVTGSTLIGLFQTARKPVKSIEVAYADAVETRKERRGARKAAQPAPQAAEGPTRFNIDVDISGDSEPGGGKAPEPELPGHPVIAPREEPDLPFPVDSPVEYISPAEFAARDAILQELETPAAPEPEPPRHPLEDEIKQAEAGTGSEIDNIIDRFLSGAGEAQAEEPPSFRLEKAEPPPEIHQEPPMPTVYQRPGIHLLKQIRGPKSENINEELKNNAQRLVDTLKSFGVQTRVTDICRGPAVTRYELQPSAGVKISKITGLSDDIALNLASAGIRIEAPIPNKAAVGIEVPNKIVSMVSIRELIDSREFAEAESTLTVALGKDIAGKITLADLGKMPHVLIAGATGSGKSVCINSIIMSLLYKASPDEVKLLMVDPKVVELGIYNGIPHLLVPVVTDPKKAAGALGWAVTEMLGRYKTFADNSVRDLNSYNKLAEKSDELQPMPKIVIIIDELADLMMAAPNEVEDSICRLAQMARAAGMHLVIATQRPSVDVITGVIKANIPSRIAFAVSSQVDSRTILDMGGAEKLLGRGDMLFYPVGASKPVRVQGCFVTDTEVESVVEFIKKSAAVEYDQQIVEDIDRHVVTGKKDSKDGGGFDDEDEMLPQAIECVVEMGQASTSSLQRRLRLGYARAARIIDQLEQKGIVGPSEGSKPRQVLISKDRWMEMKLSGAEEQQLKIADEESAGAAPF